MPLQYIHRAADLEADVGGRTLFGLVAPYGQWATVHDRSGPSRPYEERIARGAFARSIKERGKKINLTWNHSEQTTMPIGRATVLRETDEGLYAEFAVAKTARGDEALQLVHEGVVGGFSIRAGVVRSRNDSRTQVTRTELSLVNVSLTDVPVYAGAGVMGVRSLSAAGKQLPMSVDLAARLLSIRLKASNS